MIPILNDSLIEIDQEDGFDLVRFLVFITDRMDITIKTNHKSKKPSEIEG